MAEVKKWSVTYTKHLMQKRKVYHDGTIHLLNNKVMLYDECDQLLDSKFVTKDDSVKPGESLIFASFLVDIGDPDTSCNSFSNPNLQSERDNKSGEKTQEPQGGKLRNIFNNRKHNAAGKKPSSICLSPSQKIIREYKKNESLKYKASHSPTPTSPAISSSKEWEALYTTQITQKAKKYHDGFIRLFFCGSHARQVILYDSFKSQLDKRFLKKEEDVTAGESLTFDAYLVDIGDPIGATENDVDLKTHGRSYNATDKVDMPNDCQWKKPSIGQCQDDACSSKCVNSSVKCSESEKIEQENAAPNSSLRDANQILSFLRKPTVPDSNVENVFEKKFISRSSDPIPSDGVSQAFDDALQVNQNQVIKAAEKHDNVNAANGGLTTSEGNAQSGGTNGDLAGPQLNGNCSVNKLEREVALRGSVILKFTASESPCKSKCTVGSNVGHGRSNVQDSSEGEVFKHGLFSVSSCEAPTHHQTSAKVPEKSKGKEEKTSIARPIGLSANLNKRKRISVETEASNNTSEFPSFDLGI